MSEQVPEFKNILIIDVDSTREEIIKLQKPENIMPPSNEEAMKQTLLVDLTTACEGIVMIAHLLEKEGVQTKDKTIEKIKAHLEQSINNTEFKDVEKEEDDKTD
jgi:hypothetical protein